MDINLDLNTLQILDSSDPVITQLDANGVVKFTFNHILLPDSNVDLINSQGYIIYRISPITNVPDYTQINNTAYIYFDFNAAVVTNTTYNILETQIPVTVGVKEIPSAFLSFVFPNPISEISILTVPSSSVFDLRIFDSTGREILRKNVSGNFLLSKNKFLPGIYHYRLNANDGKQKFIGKIIIVQ